MPEIKNTFLKSKMNKDLDDRLIPNGEYRDAENLQISRSEGSSVGEFENIPGNQLVTNGYLNTGKNGSTYTSKVIGQYTDNTTGDIYVFSTGYEGTDQQRRDTNVGAGPVIQTGTVIQLWNPAGTIQLDPQVLGIQVGMLVQGCGNITNDPVVTIVTATTITISQSISLAINDPFTIGWANTIHRYNVTNQVLTLLVKGSFLNFSQQSKIYSTNLIEGLLFWTDNRNQPRRINVGNANPGSLICPDYYTIEDQISVCKYYPYEVPLVLDQTILAVAAGAISATPLGYRLSMVSTTGIKSGDIVTGFIGQRAQEVWEVIQIIPGVVYIYNNFYASPGTYAGGALTALTFSRPTMKNSNERLNENGFDTSAPNPGAVLAGANFTINYSYNNSSTNPTPQPTPNIGDLVTSAVFAANPVILTASALAITIADDVRINSISDITPGGTLICTLTKDVTVSVANDKISISANPDYDQLFSGDPDLIEDKFIRFSYRFKFADNEYSLAAPFTQICYIPKQEGIFGGGPQDSLQDMTDAYTSTIIKWFENRIDSIGLKIPLPNDIGITAAGALTSLVSDYQISKIEILYKESDGLSTKILESLDTSLIVVGDITSLPSTSTTQWYYTFDYKSIKPYKTLSTSQSTRVYDKVPIKALSQEVIANRIVYGNFVENHTPPANIDYEVSYNDKSVVHDNYAQYPNHSVKQNRNYQVGFVLSDRYGRQSSVILSKHDDNPTTPGSTIYLPYKTWDDVNTPGSNLTTYEWLGSVLRVEINNGITQIINNPQTGEPGVYKAYRDTSVDAISLACGTCTGGTLYTVGMVALAVYDEPTTGEGPGLGSNLTVEVTSVTLGAIDGIKIVNGGTGYVDGQLLIVKGGGEDAIIQITVNPVNVLGWQSYKFVVKQQEQEYYNAYLPGFVSGYPVTGGKDRGRVAFTALYGDNINKIPRDLNEVGPLQNEFAAAVILHGRVNNPAINPRNIVGAYYDQRLLPWNTQYFPGRNPDEATTIGPIGQNGLELANSPFSSGAVIGNFSNLIFYTSGAAAVPQIPWGPAGADQSFFNVEQNPLAAGIKIGAEKSQPQLEPLVLNTLGAQVTGQSIVGLVLTDPVACMNPFLSVSETKAVESELEIFWETSTSGDFVELNKQVLLGYDGVVGATAISGSLTEATVNGAIIISDFKFTDSDGNWITLDGTAASGSATITQILDSNGVDVTTPNPPFIIDDTPAGVAGRDFDIKTNQLFWYGAENIHKANGWTLSFRTASGGAGLYTDDLSNLTSLILNNIAPTSLGFTSTLDGAIACGATTAGFTTLSTSFGTFTGKNGSIDITNDIQELCWSLALTSFPAGSTAVFTIDATTGAVTKTSGTLINGTYRITATLTDAAASCITSANSLSSTCFVDIVIGTPDTDQAICFGETSAMAALDTSCAAGTGLPLEVFFGVSENVTNGTIIAGVGSKTDAYLSTLAAPAGSGLTSYTTTSGGGVNLRYYNVKAEATAVYSVPLYCWPAASPVFTTGALSQGIMTVIVKLSKSITALSADFQTNFTILYRANSTLSWQLATDSSSVVVGSFNALNVTGAGATTASLTYQFDTPGEYAVRSNGVQTIGSPDCGTYPTAPSVTVEFYDSTTLVTANPCADCTGPL